MQKEIYSPNTLEQGKTGWKFINNNLKAPSGDGVFIVLRICWRGKGGRNKKSKIKNQKSLDEK